MRLEKIKMKNKIITGLLVTILIGFIYTLSYKLKIESAKREELEATIETIVKQNKANRLDLAKRNEELRFKNEETNLLQKKIKQISKGDRCLNSPVNSDIVKLLRNNHI